MFQLQNLQQLVAWACKDAEAIDKALVKKFGAENIPGNWDQTAWGRQFRNGVCETAYCIAGQGAVQAGYVFGWTLRAKDEHGVLEYLGDYVYPSIEVPSQKDPTKMVRVIDEDRRHEAIPASLAGQEYLGITYYEADRLFDGGNTISDVVFVAQAIAKAYGEDLGIDVPDEERNRYIGYSVEEMAKDFRNEDLAVHLAA